MVRVPESLTPTGRRALAALLLCALCCSTLAILFGTVAAHSYRPEHRSSIGLTLQHLRPLHTTFAAAWIFLGGVTVVYFHLFSRFQEAPRGFMLRLKAQLLLWIVAGAGIMVSLWNGQFSGREYMGAHWSWSVFIYAGWILFAWNYFSVEGWSLARKPVYIYMWHTAVLLFLFAFAEGHAWMLERIGAAPLRDIAVQWKSYGPLVGSFNLLVYGSMAYLACRLSGDERPARSNTAFALLFLGLLNSFTNYGHHTYHLPQSHLIKWVSCIVSLAEAVLVVKYLLNVLACLRSVRRTRGEGDGSVRLLVTFASIWSFLHVGAAVIISVPPVNTLIHGTHFVVGHAMGSMLGIDSMILWAALRYVMAHLAPADRRAARARWTSWTFAWINVWMLILVVMLWCKGLIDGYLRYMGPVAPAPPRALNLFPDLFLTFGAALAAGILWVSISWAFAIIPVLREGSAHRQRRPAKRSSRHGRPASISRARSV